jgi:hypothetical protein
MRYIMKFKIIILIWRISLTMLRLRFQKTAAATS